MLYSDFTVHRLEEKLNIQDITIHLYHTMLVRSMCERVIL